MQRWDPLNDRQLQLLQRVTARDDLSGPDGVSERRSGRALHDRGLVRVTRKGGAWQAYPTDAGRFYLEHGHHPDHPEHREPSGGSARKQTPRKVVADARPADRAPSTDATSAETGSASHASSVTADKRRDQVQHGDRAPGGESLDSATAPRPRTGARGKTSEASASAVTETPDQPAITADLVLSRLRAAGGKLVISDVGEEEFAAWRHAVKVAQLRLLRAGRQRLSRWTVGGELRLQLTPVQAADAADDEPIEEDREAWVQASTPPPVLPRTAEFLDRRVPVPSSKVTKPHPLVEELTAAAERIDQMWREQYGPFTRLAALRRPIVRMRRIWQGLITEALFRGYTVYMERDRSDRHDSGRLAVQIGLDVYDIVLRGDSTTPLCLWVPDDTQRRRRGDSWTDKGGGPIEQRLGEVFTTIERRAERAIEQRAEQQRRDAERRRQWKTAMAEATKRYEEDQRREAIAGRIADAEYANDVRAYAHALLVRAAELDSPRDDGVLAWAAWARKYADGIDPRRLQVGMPTIPAPQPDQLKPYLRGFSPYGPY